MPNHLKNSPTLPASELSRSSARDSKRCRCRWRLECVTQSRGLLLTLITMMILKNTFKNPNVHKLVPSRSDLAPTWATYPLQPQHKHFQLCLIIVAIRILQVLKQLFRWISHMANNFHCYEEQRWFFLFAAPTTASSHKQPNCLDWKWQIFPTVVSQTFCTGKKCLWSNTRRDNTSNPFFISQWGWWINQHDENVQRQNTPRQMALCRRTLAPSSWQLENAENAIMKNGIYLRSALLCRRIKHLKSQTAAAGMLSQMFSLRSSDESALCAMTCTKPHAHLHENIDKLPLNVIRGDIKSNKPCAGGNLFVRVCAVLK